MSNLYKKTMLMSLLFGAMLIGLNFSALAQTSIVDPESLFLPIPGQPTPPSFEDKSPSPGSTIDERQPIISIKVTTEHSFVNEDLLRMWIDGCAPQGAVPGRTYFTVDNHGAFIKDKERTPGGVTIGLTFGVDLKEVGCTLSNGEINVQVRAGTGADDDALFNTDTWAFSVNILNQPLPPFLQGPVIEGLSDTSGNPGTKIKIHGANFAEPTLLNRFQGAQIFFDGDPIETRFNDSETLEFTVPDQPCGAHLIYVHNESLLTTTRLRSDSNTVEFIIPVITCLAKMRQGPSIENISPASGPVGTEVTIQGGNFDVPQSQFRVSGSRVLFDGEPVSTAVNSQSELTFHIPEGFCGEVDIQVDNGPLSLGNQRSDVVTFFVDPCEPEPELELEVSLGFAPSEPRVVDVLSFDALASNTGYVTSVEYHWFLDDDSDEVNNLDSFGDVPNCDQPCTQVLWNDPEVGPHIMTVRVITSNGDVATDTVAFDVAQANGNHPPTVTLTQLCTIDAVSGFPVETFSVNAVDPDGDFLNPLNVEWYVNDLNDGIENNFFRLNDNNGNPVSGFEVTLTFTRSDEYRFRVVVPDGNGGIGQAEVDITIDLGPSGSPTPNPGTELSDIPRELDINANGMLDDPELALAIKFWTQGQTVPETSQIINDCVMKELTRLWISGANIESFNALACSAKRASATALSMPSTNAIRLSSPNPMEREIYVLGNAISTQIQVFDLNGQLQLEQQNFGSSLRFRLQNLDGQRLPNGTYLYVVTVQNENGHWQSQFSKLLVLQ